MGQHEVAGKIGAVDYRVTVASDKVKTYHINMLNKHYQRNER